MRPLKILTLDGGGLQALSTLSILSKLCDAIAINKGSDRKPAPCELFDIIGGIGTGGWLALLLGRYRLDLTRCMSIYLELASDPQIHTEKSFFGSKPFTLDQKHLIAKVDAILERYSLSPLLLDETDKQHQDQDPEVRCKHAFAVGAVQAPGPDQARYEMFRAYRPQSNSGPFYHAGPDPATCKVSSICAATGATKYLLEPYAIGSTTFSDNGFPNPHNITDLAIDEAHHVYGEKAALGMIVNIGPGIPSDNDIEKLQTLSRNFSWPSWLLSSDRSRSTTTTTPKLSPSNSKTSSKRSNADARDFPRSDSSASSVSFEAEQVERKIGASIQDRLERDRYSRHIFVRLAPPPARDDLALNDVQVIAASSEEIDHFLALDDTKALLSEVAEKYCVAAT